VDSARPHNRRTPRVLHRLVFISICANAQRIFFTNASAASARCAIPPNKRMSVSISASVRGFIARKGKGCSRSLPTVSCLYGTDPTTNVGFSRRISPTESPCQQSPSFGSLPTGATSVQPFGHANQRVLRRQWRTRSRLRSAPAKQSAMVVFRLVFMATRRGYQTGLVHLLSSTPIDSATRLCLHFVS